MRFRLIILSLFAVRCSSDPVQNKDTSPSVVRTTNSEQRTANNGLIQFPIVDDNLHHDTLAIQVTFDMLDGSYLMVASHMEETFEGLRLYRYRFNADSSVHLLAVSPPAYDSWTMLPTFFRTDTTSTALWILANFGEKQSWGQKLLRLDHDLSDMGFIDAALPTRVVERDTAYLKRENIAPFAHITEVNDTLILTFTCDSVYLYDDQNGHTDLVLPSTLVRYTYHPSEGLALWAHGRKMLVKKPS